MYRNQHVKNINKLSNTDAEHRCTIDCIELHTASPNYNMVISRRLIDAVNWAVKTNNLCNWKVIRGELDLSPILYHGCKTVFFSCF